MKTVRFSVEGNAALSDINTTLSDQENRCSEFMASKIAYEDGKVVNLVTFTLYDDVMVPNALTLKRKGDEGPPKAVQFWEGVMAVSNDLVVVTAYRAV
jgi:hypothetical protein